MKVRRVNVSGSPWSQHEARWRNCQRCGLCKHRKKVVLGRGSLPCDVLFIGEAPGEDEDDAGRPFVGRSGSLLQKMIDEVHARIPFRYFITNCVGCRPIDGHERNRPPSTNEVAACWPRVEEVIRIAKPRLVVALGAIARVEVRAMIDRSTEPRHYSTLELYHPAYHLRTGQREVAEDTHRLRNAIRRLQHEG